MIGDIIAYAALFVIGQNCDFYEGAPGHTPRPAHTREAVRGFMGEILDHRLVAPDDTEEREQAIDAMVAGYYNEYPDYVYETRTWAARGKS